MGTVIVILFLLVFLYFICCAFVAYKYFKVLFRKNDETYIKYYDKNGVYTQNKLVQVNVDWFKEQDIKDINISSSDGHKLHGIYLAASNPQRTVICVHDYRSSYEVDFSSMIRYFNMNHSNVLVIDQRCHGESEGNFITFGAKEAEDIKQWVNTVVTRIDDKTPIFLYGIGMGASSSLLSLRYKMPYQLKGVIADSPYESLKDELSYLSTAWLHIPPFPLVSLIDFLCVYLAHFSSSETEVKEVLKKNELPILLIHGESDNLISPENTRQIFSAINDKKEILWVKDAKHGESDMKDPTLYRTKLEYFFNTYK